MENHMLYAPLFISIVMPTYNAEKYLFWTLTSIIAQSNQCWECILVDDGSTDDTLKISRYFSKIDSRIRLSSVRPNCKGANACRNAGLSDSLSDYVMFMDADDSIAPHCIAERILILSKNPNKDLIVFNTLMVDEKGKHLRPFSVIDSSLKGLVCAFIQHEIPWQTMSPVWKKKFLEKIGAWDESYKRLQDVELNIRALFNQPAYLLVEGEIDSYYRLTKLSEEKKLNALYGFTLLLKNHYLRFLTDSYWKKQEDELIESFVILIERNLKFYIDGFDQPVPDWELFFIETLRGISMAEDDVSHLIGILAIFNNDE
ncbi:glycosyltransferase [Pedobacter sp. PAMC26386]|nr:glycosyltransferase [Pedobacter sp. PAMC26386]